MSGPHPRRLRAALFLIAITTGAGAGGYWVYARGQARGRELAEVRAALADRDFTRATAGLEHYLASRPRDPDALLLAAQAARRSGNLFKTRDYLRAFRDAGGPAAAAAIEERLWRAQGGDFSEADTLLAECDQRPGSADNFPALEAVVTGLRTNLEPREKDREVIDAPDRDRAVRAAEALLATPLGSADRVEAYLSSGVLHRIALWQDRAVADLRRAVELDPAHAGARRALALTIAGDKPFEARTHLEVAVRLRPNDLPVRYELATLYRSLGQTDEAGRMLDGLLRDRPDYNPFLVQRGLAELDAGRTDGAEAYLRRAVALEPNSASALFALSRCLRARGLTAEADRLGQQAEAIAAEVPGPKR